MKRLVLAWFILACGGATTTTPPPHPQERAHAIVPTSLCTRHDDIAAPLPREIACYPLSMKTYTRKSARRSRKPSGIAHPIGPASRSTTGFISLAASRKHLRPAPDSMGETGGMDADVPIVTRFVDENPDIFGIDLADRVVTPARIGAHIQPRFWGGGVISMQAFFDSATLMRFWLRGRKFAANARDAADVLAPWADTDIVVQALPQGRRPCDPVSRDGHECDQPDPPVPTPSVEKLNPRSAQKIARVLGTPKALHEVYFLQLDVTRRPCRRIPQTIDAHTGEVFEWIPSTWVATAK